MSSLYLLLSPLTGCSCSCEWQSEQVQTLLSTRAWRMRNLFRSWKEDVELEWTTITSGGWEAESYTAARDTWVLYSDHRDLCITNTTSGQGWCWAFHGCRWSLLSCLILDIWNHPGEWFVIGFALKRNSKKWQHKHCSIQKNYMSCETMSR